MPIYSAFVNGDDFVKCILMGLTHVQYIDLRGERYADALPLLLKALGIQQADGVKPVLHAEPTKSTVAPGFIPRNLYKDLWIVACLPTGIMLYCLTWLRSRRFAAREDTPGTKSYPSHHSVFG